MASVWWARHELIGRDVALKLSPALRDEQVIGRFVREARIIGKFQHRNIVGVVDAGVLPDEGYLFLALELLRGAPFAERLNPNRPLPPEDVVPILIEVCSGLEAAHAEGVVHRDIKPENIVLAAIPGEGVVPKIVDFGISHIAGSCDTLTLEGQLLGTPSYMSPEQALGRKAIDARVDLWAVGVILYEALSGRAPFNASNHHAILRRIIDTDPAPLPVAIPQQLRSIVDRCLEKDPARRYQSAASLRADLEAALVGSSMRERAAAPIGAFSQPDAGVQSRQAATTRDRGALASPAPNVRPGDGPPLQPVRARALQAAVARAGSAADAAAPGGVHRRPASPSARRLALAAALAAALTSAALKEQSEVPLTAHSSIGSALAASLDEGAAARLPSRPGDAPERCEGDAAADPLCADRSPLTGEAQGSDVAARGADRPPRPTATAALTRRRSRITRPGF